MRTATISNHKDGPFRHNSEEKKLDTKKNLFYLYVV